MSDAGKSPDFSKELAQIALSMQSERTGYMPKAVTVVASDDTVVLTLHEALTPAEKILAKSESGAAKVEQYHRALFAVSCDELRKEIQRPTAWRPAARHAAGTGVPDAITCGAGCYSAGTPADTCVTTPCGSS